MPRRRAVVREQLEELLGLPVAEPELIQHWTLSVADLAAIERCRGDPNQLDFALQLCAFRYPGRLLRPREVIPEAALAFVAGQLRVARGAPRRLRHAPPNPARAAERAAGGFDFRMFAPKHKRELLACLLPVSTSREPLPLAPHFRQRSCRSSDIRRV
jgi:hypothetical protein